MNVCLSNQEKNFIIDGVASSVRNDGRSSMDYRPIYLETNVLSSTNGSAKVQIGATTLLVGVKVEMSTVDDTSMCENRIRFFVDFSAVASPLFAGKGGSDCAEEIADTLSKAYTNADAVANISKLVLGRTFMWIVYVDVVVLQHDGSIVDAASIGVKAALSTTEISEMIVRPADQGKQILDLPDEYRIWYLDVSRAPLIITVNKIGTHSVVDATNYEDACTSNVLLVAVETTPESDGSKIADDRITCVRKQKGGCLEMESVDDMLGTATFVARPLNTAILTHLRAERTAAERSAGDEKASTFRLLFQ